MAARIGCGQACIALTTSPVMRVKFSNSGIVIRVSGPIISCTSPPEQKLPPAPVITTALIVLSYVKARKVSRSSAYDSNVSGFFFSGRLSVIVATLPAACHKKCCAIAFSPLETIYIDNSVGAAIHCAHGRAKQCPLSMYYRRAPLPRGRNELLPLPSSMYLLHGA